MTCVPEALIVEYLDAFGEYDSNSSGIVSTKVLGSLLRKVGENPSEAEIQDLVNEVDPDATGCFKFPNFLKMMAQKIDDVNAEDEIREAFKVFDSDGNGFINRQELGFVMLNLGLEMEKEEIESLINEIDIDGDGQINYEEFYLMMTSTC